MWYPKGVEKKEGASGSVAVAVDKDRGSQNALKWATDSLLTKGMTVTLIHVRLKASFSSSPSIAPRMNHISAGYDSESDPQMKQLFLPFRCFCTRKDIECKDVILEDTDVVKAVLEYVTQAAVENLVIGAQSKGGFLRRFKTTDIPGNITKGAPDFCNVYVVSKGKVSIMRSASRPAPSGSVIHNHPSIPSMKQDSHEIYHSTVSSKGPERASTEPNLMHHDTDSIMCPLTRNGTNNKSYSELSMPDTDISFISARPSTERVSPSYYDTMDMGRTPPRLSNCSDIDNPGFDSLHYGRRSLEFSSQDFQSIASHDSERLSWSSQSYDDVEAEMRRLKLELKQTMAMYSTACREALTAKQKAMELQRWKMEEQKRLEEARLAEEAALAIAEREKARSKAALEHAEASKRIAELEAQKRRNAELKMLKETEEKKAALDALAQSDVRYFAEGRKIGEGGYGPNLGLIFYFLYPPLIAFYINKHTPF